MKSKIGLNFMVSVGRSLEAAGDNALAKLLQASQEYVRILSSFIHSIHSFEHFLVLGKMADFSD